MASTRPVAATEAFAYRWKTERVEIVWREGSGSEDDAAYRALLGHWKRLAESVWRQRGAGRLRLEATFYGPQAGSASPRVTLAAPAGTLELAAGTNGPITDDRFLSALLRLAQADRDSNPGQLPDDTRPRLSPTSAWVAFRSWRGGVERVWVAPPHGRQASRCDLPDVPLLGRSVGMPLLGHGPEWSPDGRFIAFVQAGHLCFVEINDCQGRVITTPSPVAGFSWSPSSRHLAARLEDGGLLILDLAARVAVPVHRLVPRLMPAGELSWSPGGSRLLFRAFAGVSAANFERPSAAAQAVRRLTDRLLFRRPAAEPPLTVGEYEDRLVLLDLRRRRLDTIPLAASGLGQRQIEGFLWSPAEDHVYAASTGPDGACSVLGLDLATGTAQDVPGTDTRGPLWPIGSVMAAAPAAPRPAVSRSTPLAFLDGDRVMVVRSGEGDHIERSATVTAFRLPPGPDGGFLGVEGEAITEDESSQRLFVAENPGPWPLRTRRRSADGLIVFLPLGCPMVAALQTALKHEEVVDLDVNADPMAAVIERSAGGGTADLVTIDGAGRRYDLSQTISTIEPGRIPMLTTSLPILGPTEGMATLASAFEPRRPLGRLVPIGLAVLVAGLAALIARQRGARSRRESRGGKSAGPSHPRPE